MNEQIYVSSCKECPTCDGGRLMTFRGLCKTCKGLGGVAGGKK